MLVVKMIRYHEFGNMVLYVRASRNPVLDFMTQAAKVAEPYILEGWHLVHASIE